jgi:hypothetical protein
MAYYIDEIQSHFIDNIEKVKKRSRMTSDQETYYLSLITQFDDIKNLPLS